MQVKVEHLVQFNFKQNAPPPPCLTTFSNITNKSVFDRHKGALK